MPYKNYLFLMLLQIPLFTFLSQAAPSKPNPFKHTLYIGAIGGFGSTTWSGLVPSPENQNDALNLSTPISVNEGGQVWGAFGGYEITPYFALEANYMHYPNANVIFHADSIYATINALTKLQTKTEAISFQAKVMLKIPKTQIRFYSSLGGANVHRIDFLNDSWRFSPSFGAGVNYHFTDRIMGEIAGNYTAGFGESVLSPSDTYIPFLYSVTLRLAYCFF